MERQIAHTMCIYSHMFLHMSICGVHFGPTVHSVSKTRNGLGKNLFHGTNDISQQILYNVNAQCTIQSLIYDIKMTDGDTISSYLSGDNLRSNMSKLSEHVYSVGNTELVTLTKEQQDVLNCCSDKVEVFYRLFKHGVMCHSTRYASRRCSKRNNTFCEHELERVSKNILDR